LKEVIDKPVHKRLKKTEIKIACFLFMIFVIDETNKVLMEYPKYSILFIKAK